MSLTSFKQVFIEGNEAKYLNLGSAAFAPFLLSYSIMSIYLFGFFYGAYQSMRWNNFFYFIKKILLITILGVFVLAPFVYLQYKNGHFLTIPLILILLEPLKFKYIFNKNYEDSLKRNVILLILSFILLFVAGILCKILHIEKVQFIYGGFYYLVIAHLDFKILKEKKLID